MLRETRAQCLAFATVVVVVGLAALFAWLRNPPSDGMQARAPAIPSTAPAGPLVPSPPQAAVADDARLEAGRAAFRRLNCTRCHAIEGRGNPAMPLDGVGRRLDAAALRDWALGAGAAREQLSSSVLRAKARAAGDPDLDVLIDYLAQQGQTSEEKP